MLAVAWPTMLDPLYLSAAIDGLSLSGLALSPGEIRRIRRACADASVDQFEDQPGFGIVGSILSKGRAPGVTGDDARRSADPLFRPQDRPL
jgi:hypothetical protein